MKRTGAAWLLAACLGSFLLTGCGGEKQNIYKQAEKDLEQGSYEYALSGYEASVANEYKLPESYRGVAVTKLRLGDYEGAIAYFTSALNCERVGTAMEQDLLSYRASTELKAGLYADAMADCQTLAQDYRMNSDTYFLTGKVALAMDSYDEAADNFKQAYGEEPTYDMAIQIYEAYLQRDMEADGTRYLEAALTTEPKNAEDYCDRGRVYYYMEDYESACKELTKAMNKGSTDALVLLGNVYLAQNDTSNARSMYQEYVTKVDACAKGYNGLALCDIAEGFYANALINISNGLPSATTEEMQDLLFNEIVIYEKQQDFATALQKAQEYLQIFPDDDVVEKEVIFLKSRTASYQEPTEAAEEVTEEITQ